MKLTIPKRAFRALDRWSGRLRDRAAKAVKRGVLRFVRRRIAAHTRAGTTVKAHTRRMAVAATTPAAKRNAPAGQTAAMKQTRKPAPARRPATRRPAPAARAAIYGDNAAQKAQQARLDAEFRQRRHVPAPLGTTWENAHPRIKDAHAAGMIARAGGQSYDDAFLRALEQSGRADDTSPIDWGRMSDMA